LNRLKVLITRPRAQAENFAEGLARAGMLAVFFPVIEIQPIENNLPLQRALRKLDCYDWLVFTSVNGVEVVWNALTSLGLVTSLGLATNKGLATNMGLAHLAQNVRVAAIGPKTAGALERRGVLPDFVPEEYVAEAILPGLGDLVGRWVLLPRAEIARQALPEAIAQAGGVAHEIAVYRTLPAQPDPQALQALQDGLDVITLTSPSTVHNFVAITRAAGLDAQALPGDPVFACIGPITEQAAQMAGLRKRIVADEYTTEGLIRAIRGLEEKQ